MTGRGVHKGQVYVWRQLVGEGYITSAMGADFAAASLRRQGAVRRELSRSVLDETRNNAPR